MPIQGRWAAVHRSRSRRAYDPMRRRVQCTSPAKAKAAVFAAPTVARVAGAAAFDCSAARCEPRT